MMGWKNTVSTIEESVSLGESIDKHTQEELRAAITHTAQNIGIKPPALTDELYKKICLELALVSLVGNEDSISEEKKPEQLELNLLFKDVPYPPLKNPSFTFIDLFAGIGGFRIAFQNAGGKCVFTSEWDKFAKQTYEANFGECPYGDITKIDKNEIPDHDILCAGFPCQPFSLAGVSKKNSLGRKHGFEDETQGTLFFEIKEIIKLKRPKAFMLENVKNLISHDKGNTFHIIKNTLEEELGYVINWKVVDGAKWVPQHRERIFIVGYDPKQINISPDDILIPSGPDEDYNYPELKNIINKDIKGNTIEIKDHTLGPGTWDTLERHKANHAKKGNGFGYGLHKLPINDGEVTRTISARYHKDGAEILIEQPGNRPRRLTIKEAMQLQGYNPKIHIFPVSNTQAYRQIGNSVVVPAVSACANQIAKTIQNNEVTKQDCGQTYA